MQRDRRGKKKKNRSAEHHSQACSSVPNHSNITHIHSSGTGTSGMLSTTTHGSQNSTPLTYGAVAASSARVQSRGKPPCEQPITPHIEISEMNRESNNNVCINSGISSNANTDEKSADHNNIDTFHFDPMTSDPLSDFPVGGDNVLEEALFTALNTFYPEFASTSNAKALTPASITYTYPAALTNFDGTDSLYIQSVEKSATDYTLLKKFVTYGVLDAYVLFDMTINTSLAEGKNVSSSGSKDQNGSHSNGVTYSHNTSPGALLIFRDENSSHRAVDHMISDGILKGRWEFVATPSGDSLRTPMGCHHRSCRSLVEMLHFPQYHSMEELLDVLHSIEDQSHAAMLLCSSRILHTHRYSISKLISHLPELKFAIVREVLITLFLEESRDLHVQDTMVLLAELYLGKYYTTEPVAVLNAIASQDIRLTHKILQGICMFVGMLQEAYDVVQMQGPLSKLRGRPIDPDAKEMMIELCKLLKMNRPPPHMSPPSAYSTSQTTSTDASSFSASSQSFTNSVKTVIATRNETTTSAATGGAASSTAAATGHNVSVVSSSKQTCATCNNRARYRCHTCDKVYCVECHKHDEQVHECLSRTVYISKVDPSLSDREFRNYLDHCGTVSKVRLCGDPSQRSVYGFVEFTTAAAASKLLALDRRVVGTNVIRCLPARQPIHDHSEDDAVSGYKARVCQFGLGNGSSNRLSTTKK